MPREQLNIAMLSVHSCPLGELGTSDTGGMSVYISETAREMGRQGHRVDVYTRSHGPGHERTIELGPNTRLIHIDAGENTRLPKLDLYHHLSEFAENMESYRRESHLQYDLVHSHYWLSGLVGAWARECWSVPHVVMFHTLGAIKNSLSHVPVDPDLRLTHEMELIHDCDAIVVPSEREKGEIRARYGGDPDRMVMVPCGVNLDLFRPQDRKAARRKIGLPKEENVLLYVGRIDPLKGLDRLFTAASLLKKQRPFKLLIIGGDNSPGPEQRRLSGLARGLNISDDVVFIGNRPQDQLPIYYSAADILVIPSYYESFGLVGLEALACGTPVVATDVGDYRHIIRDEAVGCLAVDGRPETIAGHIEHILANPLDETVRMDKIRRQVLPFSWSRVSEILIEKYKHLIDSTVAPLDSAFITERLCLCGRSGSLSS